MYASTFGLDYWKAATDYWRAPEQKSWILVNPGSIGDTWCTLALARAFRGTHGAPLTVVVKQSQAALAELFKADIDRVIVWDDERLLRFCLRLVGAGHFDLDEPIIAHPIWHGSARNFYPLIELLRHDGRGGVNFADQWRLMLRLDWGSPLTSPPSPQHWREEALSYAVQLEMPKGDSVILFPDNNTNPPLPDSIWERIALGLKANGKTVFTNVIGNSKGKRPGPIASTRAIEINLHNAVPLVEYAGRYVTMANGMQGYLMGSRVRAQHTFLLSDWGADQPLHNMGYTVKDPLAVQSARYYGFSEGPFLEYAIDAKDADDTIIDAAVNNRPDHVWRP
jgi:hypothetical protein